MAVKQNAQFIVPELPASAPPEIQAWWRQVKYAFDQVVPQLISNVNELVDGSVRLLRMEKLAKAPTDVQEGWIAWADGTNWNPGAGEGIYEYRSGVWNKL